MKMLHKILAPKKKQTLFIDIFEKEKSWIQGWYSNLGWIELKNDRYRVCQRFRFTKQDDYFLVNFAHFWIEIHF